MCRSFMFYLVTTYIMILIIKAEISFTTVTKESTEVEHSNITSTEPLSSHQSTNMVFVTSSLTSMVSYFDWTTSDYTKSTEPGFFEEQSPRSVPDNITSSLSSKSDSTDFLRSLVTVSVALSVLVITAVLVIVRHRRKKAHLESKGNRFEIRVRQPNTDNENLSYEKPWDGLKIQIIDISECQMYGETKNQGSLERHIFNETKDQYQHLDCDVRSKRLKFLEAEYDSSIATVSFPGPDINDASANIAITNVVSTREQKVPLSKNKFANENVAYCDTAIVHTKFLYATPNQSNENANNS